MRNDSVPFFAAVTEPTDWHAPPPKLTLSTSLVHVWRACLDQDIVRLHRLELNLSADEWARAARFRFARDRERFVAARGLLREILSLYLDVEARRLSFGYGTNGKPFLAEHSALRFNVSHSLDTVLIAVAHKRKVGVDIEHARGSISAEEIAETVFSAPERHALRRLDGEAKDVAFLRFWTRKEAYVKADGRGVSLPLEHIDVSAPTDRVAALDEATGEWRVLTGWTLRTLAVVPDHAASLAVEDQGWELACWQWLG
jgi:4'-phosphopantetheinyl transferase